MSNKSKLTACPLCGAGNSFAVRRISTAQIEQHWRKLGYDLRSSFPGMQSEIEKRRCPNCDLRFFTPQMIGGPDLYAALGRTESYYGAFKPEFLEVLRLLAQRPCKGSFLEFGCGSGHFLMQAAHYFEHSVGVEMNAAAAKECQARNLDVREIDIAELESHSYDVIAAFQVLEHVPDPGGTLRQLVRLLRPEGLLVIAVPNEDSFLGELEKNFLNLPPHHASCWTRMTFDAVARMFSLNLAHYWCEPLDTNLYLAALHERMDRHLPAQNAIVKLINSVVRREAVALALANFNAVGPTAIGHTHVAVFRNTAAMPQ